ncbi:MAG: TM0106 family RecB-like putative nuclease, partial [Thermodesulfobacteriota bacterium]
EELLLIQSRGQAHESRYARKLKQSQGGFTDIDQAGYSLRGKVQATLEAMRAGVDCIYQPSLMSGCFFGTADFLRKVSMPSDLGDFSYEVVDTKLARSPRTRFVVQLAFYSKLLTSIQGVEPGSMRVVLGDMTEKTFACKDSSRYLNTLIQRFFQRIQSWQEGGQAETYPEPCALCDVCEWLDICEQRRLADDHLWQVAGITKTQIKKLNAAGINTLAELGGLDEQARIPGLAPQTREKISSQAALQLKARQTGKNHLEILELDPGLKRGFFRLPRPSPGDLFFDMEGDPLEDGGLEYLFGVYFFDGDRPVFKAYWAHTRSEEKKAFEGFMDFVTARLQQYPQAHIYHYAHYEATALKKLMSLHGTREVEVDNLLRAGKLVDLYKVVRESLRVSEPSYSIKNLEHFYLEKRSGGVQDAGASIVYYERWKETGDNGLLQQIEDYNFDDVRSTFELRQWLLGLRPSDLPWANESSAEFLEKPASEELTAHEQRISQYRELLVDPLPEDPALRQKEDYVRELTWQFLDFHRREDKPKWWAMFSRQEMEESELIEDVECLGGVTLDPKYPPRPERRSLQLIYSYPDQETKIKKGDSVICVETTAQLRNLELDEENNRVSFTISMNALPLPGRFNIGPGGPINNRILREAVFRFADSLITGNGKYQAVEALLRREPPRIKGLDPGKPVIDKDNPVFSQIIEAIAGLDRSSIFVQGPPGSGKTYTGSHVIVELLRRGYRVGVSSNSHKAINNLLLAVEKVAEAKRFVFHGIKKSTRSNESSLLNGRFIRDVFDNAQVTGSGYRLLAGTAWLFSRPELDQQLDFLFVDEAGQVSLCNIVAMGTSARNIVLLGDQMQLGQPIQGVHPG